MFNDGGFADGGGPVNTESVSLSKPVVKRVPGGGILVVYNNNSN